MKYWWIIANDRWNWIKDQKIDEIEPWEARTEKGRIKKYFKQVKFGDKVIGYQSGKSKAVVAIGIIEQVLYENANLGKCIDIRKTKELVIPISIEEIRRIPILDNKFKDIMLNTTILPLDENEYNMILALEKKMFFDDDGNFEDIIKILEADDTVTKAEPKTRPEYESYSLTLWKRTPQYSKEALNKAKFVLI